MAMDAVGAIIGPDESSWAFEELDRLCGKEPDAAWGAILAVVGRTSNAFVLENVSAGPLETLLVYNGSAVIDKVEEEARIDPRFREVLGGVWRNIIPDDIWLRVVKSSAHPNSEG